MGLWSSAAFIFFLVNHIRGEISVEENENLLRKSEVASPQSFLAALSDTGTFVFSGLGNEYAKAIQTLRKSAPNCIQESLEIELEDGSRRFTTARDSETATQKFPKCVQEDIEYITHVFDKVDKFVMDVLKNKFSTSLLDASSNNTFELEDLPTKSHLHVYQKDLKTHESDSHLSLPFHTDSGLYLLLTPSNLLPLQIINRNGVTDDLHTKDDSLIFLIGTGLSSWLLPEEALFAPPHAVPSLTNSNFLTRTVFARMKVAPLEATTTHSEQSFGEHFYSSLTGPNTSPYNAKEARHQARLRRQVGGGHEQHWPGESKECVKDGVYLTWFNGEPIAEMQNSTPTKCQNKCRDNPDCDAWTINTRNGWCALKREDQVKEKQNAGFVSGFKNCNRK